MVYIAWIVLMIMMMTITWITEAESVSTMGPRGAASYTLLWVTWHPALISSSTWHPSLISSS